MSQFWNVFGALTVVISWLAGIVFAQGWLKLVAIFVPPYAWYLVTEHSMRGLGWV